MTVYWGCLDCDLIGNSDRSAEQHTRATNHTTITSTDPQRLARMTAGVCGEAVG